MRRWNGWGDDAIDFPLNEDMRAFLRDRVGAGTPPTDATLAQACRAVAPSRLPPQRGIDTAPEVRLRHALGQSLPDWLKLRYGKVDRVPDGVAFPESGEQVRELLAYAKQASALVIPYGGGTSVVGHLSVPDAAQPVLTISLARLSRLLDLDRQAQLATFGAGVAGPDLEAQLRAHGYTLGHFPQSFEYSTLGGWVVTRSSGQQSLRYGRIEQLFAGGKVETPSGTLAIPSFPASAAGTDLREVVLGSEGRIGILTEATVRITSLPQREAFHAVFFPTWAAAEDAVRSIAQARLPLSMLRLSNSIETLTMLTMAGKSRLLSLMQAYLGWRGCRGQKCMLLVGASGDAAGVASAIGQALEVARRFHGVHVGEAIGKKWKHNRFRNVYLRNALWQHGYAVDTVETAVDWPRVGAMMHAVEQAARDAFAACGERAHIYTHLSHMYAQGASVYSTFAYRLAGSYEADLARWQALKGAVCDAIVATGGTISHQHGVGIDHAPYLAAEKGTLGLGAMRELCRHFDPSGMMNPGKLLAA
ncbi:FAD-binding oxidoreductase [Noviherbaspirillum autotrophicum]|uniref:FAD-linked oxidase n=1 Tax=Noviherbaspirillum autotrophicum TaxID=709839 RepID=A0A0C2BR70_9BURK|nr:FAD-binding oxidoreductase [Noviherbaspirillum autotrophicum]KIF80566.1 FAD-linked oxidase [Noviherbaspirillum autotrophicum]